MRHVQQADGALVLLTQRFTQHPVERRKTGTGSQQPERSRLPINVVMQGATAQLTKAQRVANLQAPRCIAECTGQVAIDVKLQAVVLALHTGQ